MTCTDVNGKIVYTSRRTENDNCRIILKSQVICNCKNLLL